MVISIIKTIPLFLTLNFPLAGNDARCENLGLSSYKKDTGLEILCNAMPKNLSDFYFDPITSLTANLNSPSVFGYFSKKDFQNIWEMRSNPAQCGYNESEILEMVVKEFPNQESVRFVIWPTTTKCWQKQMNIHNEIDYLIFNQKISLFMRNKEGKIFYTEGIIVKKYLGQGKFSGPIFRSNHMVSL